MSILATLVQVEPRVLDRILVDPSAAAGLFGPDPAVSVDIDQMRAAILARGPQLLAGAIEMHPSLRDEIEKRVGKTYEALRSGEGGDALLGLMQEGLGGQQARPIEGAHGVLSLDKAWHGLHYVLSGTAELDSSDALVSQAVLGGAEFGEDFSGYGPARYFDAGQVAGLAAALADPQVEQEAVARFDAQRMTELQVYPFGWGEEDCEWLMSAFADLRSFYAGAAAEGWGVVTCLV
jgi:Domain of unknown function (DUF1877)